jgi:hypothetical protein
MAVCGQDHFLAQTRRSCGSDEDVHGGM